MNFRELKLLRFAEAKDTQVFGEQGEIDYL